MPRHGDRDELRRHRGGGRTVFCRRQRCARRQHELWCLSVLDVWNFAIIEAALQYCIDKNVVLVAASGNENQNVSRFPGSDPRTICVGGSNRDDVRKAVGDTSVEIVVGRLLRARTSTSSRPVSEIPTTDRLGGRRLYANRLRHDASTAPHRRRRTSPDWPASSSASIRRSTNAEVRKIISETTDKINLGRLYLPGDGRQAFRHLEQRSRLRPHQRSSVRSSSPARRRRTNAAARGPAASTCRCRTNAASAPAIRPGGGMSSACVSYETRYLRLPLALRFNEAVSAGRVQ